MDKVSNVILDIECLTQPTELCCTGSPKMTKVLSRKGSIRMEKHTGEEQKADDALKKLVIKVPSLPDQPLKQPLVSFKSFQAVQSVPNPPVFQDMGEGRCKRSNHLTIHPRKILLFFATMSSIGTMILIYFTLAINRKNGAYLWS
ncbi:uncharacterized protein LOC135646260 isoform X2 [Musa acuminata AAA Group]|uniref:uncharacterized protein LOC135646260 isoform X2 n=1 Tax=Musa acuminata AAA Group TaxID=214697 RepID=UPI0031CE6A9F